MIEVAHTVEFDRIAALPRRALTLAEATEWATFWTPLLALTPTAQLRPWQAQSLSEALDCGGAWLALPVGQGKTLLSWLLPTVLEASRTLLLVPASLVSKTQADFAAYAGVWRAPRCPIRIETREKLATAGSADLLTQYAPDLIVLDESDDLSNARSAAVRRLDRYIRQADVCVVAMSGTPARKSIMGYWHQLCWCLGDSAPVPLKEEEARSWGMAIDYHNGARPKPGPLGGTVKEARRWYRDRLVSTPGVVVVDEDSCDAPLTIRVRIADDDPILDAAFERFLTEQESPGGIPVSDPLSRWLLDGQLGLGLYTVWDPAPPEEWRQARRAVARFVRETIDASTRSHRPLDTEAQVFARHSTHPTVRAWRDIKHTFDGATRAIWITRSTLDYCARWLAEADAPAIVWCGSVDFAEELARMTGLAYYGAGGETADGRQLYAAPRGMPFIASWNANKKGQHLPDWPRQLITMPPQSAKWLEQIIGRSHRSGQTQRVICDVLATSGGTLDLFETSIGEARNVRATITLTQKILRADIVREKPTKTKANEYRWARRLRDGSA